MTPYRIATLLILICLIAAPISAKNGALESRPMITAAEDGNQLEAVKTFLRPRTTAGNVTVWIYFTDKGVFDISQFEQAARNITLTDNAKKRREKMGITGITFGDLPVRQTYIQGIIDLGANFRRSSRWLNAASFDLPLDRLDEIDQLPYVAKIRPVAQFTQEYATEDHSVKSGTGAGTALVFNYGEAFNQLNMLNVPMVHDKGYDGAGVIVAMLDTGFRKTHEAFADIIADGRLLAEHDFIFNDGETANEAADWSTQWNHGTYTWSTLGGAVDGTMYGPAFGASFVLCKTEDVRSETPVEEDNWMAAVEYCDSIGVDVISSSLGYSDWYSYSDFDGQTATVTIAANLATSYGIVVCNSMGNNGPSPGTLSAPADAFEILSCGALNSTGTIASFSSRGPTYDGRMKPEVSAQGVSTYCASAGSDNNYSYVNGTSLSTPLIGGCAAILLDARPNLTPQLVRQAFMESANRATNPDNNYGWGVPDMVKAISWGVKFDADITTGQAPLEVSFTDVSPVPAADWIWSFGDGDSVFNMSATTHTYESTGIYDVSLQISSDGRMLTNEKPSYIMVLADTLSFTSDSAYAGQQLIIDVNLTNSQSLESLIIPFDWFDATNFTLESYASTGTRTEGFATELIATTASQRAIRLLSGGTPLAPGSGPVLRLTFNTNEYAFGNTTTPIDSVTFNGKTLDVAGESFNYVPAVYPGSLKIRDVIRGDANHDGVVNIGDAVFDINYVFKGGDAPLTFENGDANGDFQIDSGDAVYIVNYIFKDGPAPNDL